MRADTWLCRACTLKAGIWPHPDDHDDIIEHLFHATEGIEALREIDWDEEEEDR